MKKTAIVCVILILVGLAGTLAFLSLGRAGGEIGFDASIPNCPSVGSQAEGLGAPYSFE